MGALLLIFKGSELLRSQLGIFPSGIEKNEAF
jgi:hypothetical protein